MATVNLTNDARFFMKKDEGVFGAQIKGVADVSGTDEYVLGNIPENALVTGGYVVVKTANGAVATVQVKVGGVNFGAAADVNAVAVVALSATAVSGSGAAISITPSVALASVVEFDLILKYVEYRKQSGEMTPVS